MLSKQEWKKILSIRMDGGIGMARKSRKNRNVESNIQTVVKKENLLDTAAYIRLSVENGGNETDETLVVQQMLVERFIEEHPDLRLEEVYIDNGFTGTNFERPGFNEINGRCSFWKGAMYRCKRFIQIRQRLSGNRILPGDYIAKVKCNALLRLRMIMIAPERRTGKI